MQRKKEEEAKMPCFRIRRNLAAYEMEEGRKMRVVEQERAARNAKAIDKGKEKKKRLEEDVRKEREKEKRLRTQENERKKRREEVKKKREKEEKEKKQDELKKKKNTKRK